MTLAELQYTSRRIAEQAERAYAARVLTALEFITQYGWMAGASVDLRAEVVHGRGVGSKRVEVDTRAYIAREEGSRGK